MRGDEVEFDVLAPRVFLTLLRASADRIVQHDGKVDFRSLAKAAIIATDVFIEEMQRDNGKPKKRRAS